MTFSPAGADLTRNVTWTSTSGQSTASIDSAGSPTPETPSQKTAALTRDDIEQLADSTGRVVVCHSRAQDPSERRWISSSTMRALSGLERSVERVLNLMSNRIVIRISRVARQAGLEPLEWVGSVAANGPAFTTRAVLE